MSKETDIEEAAEKFEHEFIERLIEELPEYGIDTSKWEYDYGDNCYTAIEFLSRIIKGQPVEQPTDEEIEAMAEKEYPVTELNGALPGWYLKFNKRDKETYIKGAKAMLQYKPEK